MLDLSSPTLRIIECPACQEPFDGDQPCPGCGGPAAPPAAGDGTDAPGLPVDLRRPPAEFARLDQLLRAGDLAELRRAWEDRKARLAEPHEPADEFDALWLAASLARIYGGTGDATRERAVLETALERLTVPVYQVLLRARLARGAAFARHFELAEQWLAACPRETGIPEVDADVGVARALLALQTGRQDEVLEILGETDEGGVDGLTRPLADLVRIDALEKQDRLLTASYLYRRALRRHGAFALQSLVTYYGFARAARRRALAFGIGAVVLVLVAAGIAAWWFLARR